MLPIDEIIKDGKKKFDKSKIEKFLTTYSERQIDIKTYYTSAIEENLYIPVKDEETNKIIKFQTDHSQFKNIRRHFDIC